MDVVSDTFQLDLIHFNDFTKQTNYLPKFDATPLFPVDMGVTFSCIILSQVNIAAEANLLQCCCY